MKKTPKSVHFDCALRGLGWMQFEFRIGTQEYGVRASWMTPKALGDLIDAVTELSQGAPRTQSQMAQEPGSYRWIFTQEDGAMRLRILLFDRSMWSREPDEDGIVVFGGRCNFNDFQ